MRLIILLVIASNVSQKVASYTVPIPTLEALHPKGFIVSIEDDDFSYIRFYGKLNEEISDENDVDWYRNITMKTSRRDWVFKDRNLKLELGDTLYYSIYVTKDEAEYSDHGFLTVTEFVDATPPPASRYGVESPAYSAQSSAYQVRPAPVEPQQSAYAVRPPPLEPQKSAYAVRPPPLEPQKSAYAVRPPPLEPQKSAYEVRPPPVEPQKSAYAVRPPPLEPQKSAYEVRPLSIDSQKSSYEVRLPPSNPTYDVKPAYETKTSTQRTTTTPKCEDSLTVVQGQRPVCGGSLIFSEEFDKITSVSDLTNWEVESKFPEEPDYPFNVYIPEHTIKFHSGALVITPVLTENIYGEGYLLGGDLDLSNRCTGKSGSWECVRKADGATMLPPVMTGKVSTKHKFAFKYGKVEIRAKLPAGAWLLPELNLEPLESVYGNLRYESGTMRVAFIRGNDIYAKKLYGGAVLSDEEPYRSNNLKETFGIDSWNKDYHNYTMVWKPDSLHLFVDGQQYGSLYPGEGFHASARAHAVPHASSWLKGSIMAPLDQMFYISLGLRVGGINDFADGKEVPKPWKNRSRKAMLNFWTAKNSWFPTWVDPALKIDYIKVYAL